MSAPLSRRERRIGRRLAARGEQDLFTTLAELRGVVASDRWRLESLLAVGGEGAIYVARDLSDRAAPVRVAKVALAPWHAPHEITSALVAEGRRRLAEEERILRGCGSPFLPQSFGLASFANPHLEAARGGALALAEPCLVLEKLPGQDLDVWICRVHRGGIAKEALRPHLDRLSVGLLQALADLRNRGFVYADLRPGNLRVVGRPKRRIRLLDAGGLVPLDGADGRFPHVPSYLPPQAYRALESGQPVRANPALEASMAGRTLYELATGQSPRAGQHVDVVRLLRSAVSPPVAEVIAALANGDYEHCAAALTTLAGRARRRASGA
jgi:hypothetical protein